MVEGAAVLCEGDKIVFVGVAAEAEARAKQHAGSDDQVFDCAGAVVLPGFVDSHTHPVFTSPRLIDFEQRIQGSTYEQVAKAGGGIRASVEGVRKASEEELARFVSKALRHMQRSGTTTVEAKSGYGLTNESEIKSLRAIRRAGQQWPGTVVSTLLGAHVVPAEFQQRADAYVDLVCNEMIPATARERLAD